MSDQTNNIMPSDQNAIDPVQAELEAFAEAIESAGLDVSDQQDFRLFSQALDDTSGDFQEALALAKQRRPATKGLNDYFQTLRENEDQSNPLPTPKQKDPVGMTATAVLDDYFQKFRQKVADGEI